MKQSRLDILKRVYKEAVDYGTLHSGLTIPFDEFLDHTFDYEYLEEKGFIKFGELPKHDLDKAVIYITVEGVDFVEEYTIEPGKHNPLLEAKKLLQQAIKESGRTAEDVLKTLNQTVIESH